jgi:hypothetical protein
VEGRASHPENSIATQEASSRRSNGPFLLGLTSLLCPLYFCPDPNGPTNDALFRMIFEKRTKAASSSSATPREHDTALFARSRDSSSRRKIPPPDRCFASDSSSRM